MKITGTFSYDVASKSLTFSYDGDDFYTILPVQPVVDADYHFRDHASASDAGKPVPSLPAICMALNPKAEKRGQVMLIIEREYCEYAARMASAGESGRS